MNTSKCIVCGTSPMLKMHYLCADCYKKSDSVTIGAGETIINLKNKIADMEKMLIENIKSNKQAAINSPQCADWSNGVAAGLEKALKFLQEQT